MEDDKQVNKLVFGRLPAQEDNPVIFLAPLAAWAIISSVLWLGMEDMGSPWDLHVYSWWLEGSHKCSCWGI